MMEQRKELQEMLVRRGLPGDLQRDIYNAMLPIFGKYLGMRAKHINRDRVLGLAVEAMRETFFAAGKQ